MKEPSTVSSRHMPAVNSTGRHMMAYHGSPAAALVPASTSSAISVAVSKPSPNNKPTGYMCQDLVIDLVKRPSNRFIRPAVVQLPLQFGRVGVGIVFAPAQPREHAQYADQDDDVEKRDRVQEHARDAGADQTGVVVQRRGVVADRSARPS